VRAISNPANFWRRRAVRSTNDNVRRGSLPWQSGGLASNIPLLFCGAAKGWKHPHLSVILMPLLTALLMIWVELAPLRDGEESGDIHFLVVSHHACGKTLAPWKYAGERRRGLLTCVPPILNRRSNKQHNSLSPQLFLPAPIVIVTGCHAPSQGDPRLGSKGRCPLDSTFGSRLVWYELLVLVWSYINTKLGKSSWQPAGWTPS
jgi:hypothetical protein